MGIDIALLAVGRFLIGGAFVVAGLRNIQARAFVSGLMAARGVPQASAVLWLGIVAQVAAGAALIAGFQPVAAAAILCLFLLAATPMFHNFWDYQGPERVAKINGTIGNVGLFGGLLSIVAHGL